MTAAPEHAPLNRDRHAELVAYICRSNPRAWRVAMSPTVYIYDDRDRVRSAGLELVAAGLRVEFNSVTDWVKAVKIIKRLLDIDASCTRMSIGSRIDGVDYYGEYVGTK